MASFTQDNIYRVRINWSLPQAVEAQSVYTFKCTSAGGGDTEDWLADFITNQETAWAAIEDYVTDEVESTTTELAELDPVTDEWNTIEVLNSSTLVGAAAIGDMLPHGNSPIVRFFTAVAKRQAKKFLVGFLESTCSDSILTVAVEAALAVWAVLVDNSITEGGNTLVAGVYNDTLGFKGLSQTAEVNTITGYQRRRKPGVGI